MTLTDFLLARISEDEAVARNLIAEGPWNNFHATDYAGPTRDEEYSALHIGAGRVLAKCEADRRIVELHTPEGFRLPNGYEFVDSTCPVCAVSVGHLDDEREQSPCDTLRALGLPFADHPEYREEWAL